MKNEHQSDLQTNDLAELIRKGGAVLRKNGLPVLIGVCAITIAIVAWLILASQSRANNETGWKNFAGAKKAEDFARVADQHEGTVIGAWARLKDAETNLRLGIQVAFTNRPDGIAAISELKQAKEGFENLLDGRSLPRVVRERALIGLARYLEATCDGKTEAAIGVYRQFIAEFRDSSQVKFAEERIQGLESVETKEFYGWFFKQNPIPQEKEEAKPATGQSEAVEQPADSSKSGQNEDSTTDAAAQDDPTAADNPQPPAEKKASDDLPATPSIDPAKEGSSKSDNETETR